MTSRPSNLAPRPSDGEQTLVRAVGTWGLAAAIVNVTIGGGIFRLPTGAAQALGAAAPIAYVVCAIAMGLIVLCFAEAGSRVSLTGSVYAYVEVAFGPFVGFLTGAMLWVGITFALSAVSSFFADSLGALVPALGTGLGRTLALAIVLGGLAVLNVLGVRGANRFNAAMTITKLLPLAVLIVGGAFAIHSGNLVWTHAPHAPEVARASTILIFAFLGVESALVPGGEVRDPARTVPRAVFLAMAAVAIIYLAVQLVTQGILGAALTNAQTPLADAAGVAFGDWGRLLILVGSSISMFGYVSGMTMAVPRMLFAFARDGFLPARLATVSPRFHTPVWAIAVQTVLVAALALSGQFERLAIVANGAVLLVYSGCCIAAWELRRRDVRAGGAPFRVPAGGLVPVLALAVIGWLLASLTLKEWLSIGGLLAAAMVFYVAAVLRRRAEVVHA